MPMSPPSSWEWMASYRPARARRSAVSDSNASSGSLANEGPIFTLADERRPERSEHAQARHHHVLAERVGDEIDLMPEIGEGADAVKLAEGRAARLEKRLGRDHQDAHAVA